MGLRVSVMVACAITWFLVNFPHEGVTINTYVDNVRFAGDLLWLLKRSCARAKPKCQMEWTIAN